MTAMKNMTGSATTPRSHESLVKGVADSDSSTNGAATTNVHQTVAATKLANELRPFIFLGRLTFDMSGGWKRAQPAGNRSLDGGVRPDAASSLMRERPTTTALSLPQPLTLAHVPRTQTIEALERLCPCHSAQPNTEVLVRCSGCMLAALRAEFARHRWTPSDSAFSSMRPASSCFG
jgi:hypothetical protein